MTQLVGHVARVIEREIDMVHDVMSRNDVRLMHGRAAFEDPHTLRVERPTGARRLTADNILIAVGTKPSKPPGVEVDGKTITTSDSVLNLEQLPRTMVVVGAGVIGIEYASMFAALGVQVTVIDQRPRPLEFLDQEIVDELIHQMRKSDVVLFSAGRIGATEDLNLEAAGLAPDDRGRLKVNEAYRTSVSHIFAAGDVIGFPALAATSAEQGRLAACWMFGAEAKPMATHFPVGIYAIPEVSMVGKTEEELTAQKIPYETGIARYNEISRGPIVGDDAGMFKMLFHREDGRLLGCHCIGSGATELIHVGQAVLALGGGLDYFLTTVFNYPTLAECYKVAALDGVNRVRSTPLILNSPQAQAA
jgi:NAD(P) transhydrogenase